MTEATILSRTYPTPVGDLTVLARTDDDRAVVVGGAKVRPIDLTAALLFPMWKLAEGEGGGDGGAAAGDAGDNCKALHDADQQGVVGLQFR